MIQKSILVASAFQLLPFEGSSYCGASKPPEFFVMDTQIAFDNLCPECDYFFEKNPLRSSQFERRPTYHLTVAELQASSQGGCHLCCLILECFRIHWENGAQPSEIERESPVWLSVQRLSGDERQVRLRAYLSVKDCRRESGSIDFWKSELYILPLVS